MEMNMLKRLFDTIEDRKANPKPGSYTNQLFEAGEDEILKKVGEEAMEVILAAKQTGATRELVNQRLIEEVADLVYHTLVLLSSRGLRLEDIEEELVRRHTPDIPER
jgi:phosphoribosyl-ATP pyrophosphohydrolase